MVTLMASVFSGWNTSIVSAATPSLEEIFADTGTNFKGHNSNTWPYDHPDGLSTDASTLDILNHLDMYLYDGNKGEKLFEDSCVYCVHLGVDIRSWKDYSPFLPSEASGHSRYTKEFLWIVTNGFHETNLEELKTASGIADLTEGDARLGTQYALWIAGNSGEADPLLEAWIDSLKADGRTMVFARYLVDAAKVKKDDIEEIAGIDVSFNTAVAKYEDVSDTYYYGPMSVSAKFQPSGKNISEDISLSFSGGTGVTFADAVGGSALTIVKADEPFYIVISSGDPEGIEIVASTNGAAGVQPVIFGAKGSGGTIDEAETQVLVGIVPVSVDGQAEFNLPAVPVSTPNPEISTSAVEKDTGNKIIEEKSSVTIVDTVAYKNLTVGVGYLLKGKLYDKSTSAPILIGGVEVTSEKSFIPTTSDGVERLEFTFDATGLDGKNLVVFEKLFEVDSLLNETEVATHEDINDVDQTVKIEKTTQPGGGGSTPSNPEPFINTSAKGKESGTKEIEPNTVATIVDTVSYYDLTVGATYEVKGILYDKETKRPLLVDGKEVSAKKTFVPDTKDGTIEVEFTFDASELAGKDLVVFQKLIKDNKEIAVHEDINDKNQTVTVKEIKPEDPKPEEPKLEDPKPEDLTPERPEPPTVEVDENGVPLLGVWNWDEEKQEWVFTESIPLGSMAPQTGDNTKAGMYGVIIILAIAAITFLLKSRKTKKTK